jgi:hypothetical protein
MVMKEQSTMRNGVVREVGYNNGAAEAVGYGKGGSFDEVGSKAAEAGNTVNAEESETHKPSVTLWVAITTGVALGRQAREATKGVMQGEEGEDLQGLNTGGKGRPVDGHSPVNLLLATCLSKISACAPMLCAACVRSSGSRSLVGVGNEGIEDDGRVQVIVRG